MQTVINAEVRYLEPDGERPAFIVPASDEPATEIGSYVVKAMPVSDGRQLAKKPGLDAEGFSLIEFESKFSEPEDDAKIIEHYYPMVTSQIKALTGARHVIAYDHNRRSDADIPGSRPPASHVHIDYTEQTAQKRALELLEEQEGQINGNFEFMQLNLWKAFDNPVLTSHLGLIDGRTVDRDDLIEVDIIRQDGKGVIYGLRYNPKHRWYYYPAMQVNEALLLKGYDSGEVNGARFAPHSAFTDTSAPPISPPRKSIEVRTFVYF